MTLVYGTPNHDHLQQVQIGPIDIVSTIAAANAAWGWFGGFTGIARIMRYGRGYLSAKAGTKVFGPLNIDAATFKILTYNGIVTFQDQVTDEAFGGDPSTQMLGATICALGFQMTKSACIEQFMTYLAPGLLKAELGRLEGLKEALHRELVDNIAIMLNEGAARGLTTRFTRAIESLSLSGAEGNFPRYEAWGEERSNWPSEWYLIGGFLKWLGGGAEGQYPTRSALVAKVAACLKEIGYRIGFIRTWDGVSPRLATSGSGIWLVIGGTSQTDPFVDENIQHIKDFIFPNHYRYATTGAMLLNSLQAECGVAVEVAQQYFVEINSKINDELDFQWQVAKENFATMNLALEPYAFSKWKQSHQQSSRIAVRLAAFYFPQSAEVLAHFYNTISDERTLSVVQSAIDCDSRREPLPVEVVRHRIITASICLAIISRSAGEDYHGLQHCSVLHLRYSRFIRKLSENVDKLASNCLPFGDIALLLGAIHCGTPIGTAAGEMRRDEEADPKYNANTIIGYRNGIYAVLPKLLFSLASGPSPLSLGFQCIDSYLANIPTGNDGIVRSYGHGINIKGGKSQRSFHELSVTIVPSVEETQVTQSGQTIFLGAPRACPPDKPLYLNIERPVDFSEPLVGLCGRLNGKAIGNVGVAQILRNMIVSFAGQIKDRSVAEPCIRHTTLIQEGNASMTMFNVPASVWGESEFNKPTADPDMYTYIPVLGDSAWALFIAGETACRFSMGCAWCATETSRGIEEPKHEKVVIIGYK